MRRAQPAPHWLRAVAGCAFVAAATCSFGGGPSYARDDNRVHSFVVGASPGFANSEWLDASNSSRARTRFPRSPEITLRTRLSGGIGQSPASDALGNLIVVHAEPRVSKLDAQGRTLWTQRIESEASSPPVLTSDGTILLLTQDAQAIFLAPSGKSLHRHALPLADTRHRTLAIPTSNGGALVASGTDLLELDRSGEIARQTHAQANVTAVAECALGLLAICDNGAVALAHETGDFESLASLGGTAPEGAAVQNGKLFAVVDGHKLVALDLSTRGVTILANDPATTISGPPALFENHSSVVVADGGFLSLHGPSGNETARVSIAQAGQAFDPATRALRPALLIGDAVDAVAATRSGSDALILEPDGKVQRLDNTGCLDPFRPTPSLGGVVFACRSGQLFWVNGTTP